MEPLGIVARNNEIEDLSNPDINPKPKRPRFEETEAGDIRIYYYRLNGSPYTYHPKAKSDERTWAQPYYRDRYQVPRTLDSGKVKKYHAPAGSYNCPYFTPQIIAAYNAQTPIPLLIVTEGEFKAVAGCNAGLHVVGVSGIHNFYDPDSKKIHADIVELMRACKTEKLLFLTDADTQTITYKPDKDLAERPQLFYSAVANFREAALFHISNENDFALRDVYYGHIATKHRIDNKGLDDLLLGPLAFKRDQLVNDIQKLTFEGNENFYICNVTDGLNKIREHFGLSSPEKFYSTYVDFIKDQEFFFRRQWYHWDKETELLHRIAHQDVKKFMRIGCDWFKLVEVPNKYGEMEEEIKKWKVGEITRDYEKKYPSFLEDVLKYDAWCNVPSMNGSYQRNINNCFNIFNPMRWKAAPGNCDASLGFLKHLFRGEATVTYNEVEGTYSETAILGDPFTVALDYLTIMHRFPMHILPVLCLVSPENNTGKSTFLKWLRDIYGSNATIIDNERFKQSFNSHYITKYVIGIDEGFLDVDKRSEKERLKKLATDDRQFLEFKGADVQEVPFYAKIIICSNDADSLMKIDEGEIRWFVVRVKPFEKEIVNLRETMRGEIPAFLNFLSTRQIAHPQEGRAWFNPEYIKTEQLQKIIETTRPRIERVVDDYIIETFETFKCSAFKIDLKGLAERINQGGFSKYKIDTHELKVYLKDKKGMQPGNTERISFPFFSDTPTMQLEFDSSRVARCYHFKVDEWVKAAKVVEKVSSEPKKEDAAVEDDTPF